MDDNDLAPRLAAVLHETGYSYDRVAEVLGASAHDALARNETVPARRRTVEPSPLNTLIRLFLLQTTVDRDAAEAALPGLVDRMAATGFLATSVAEVAARLDIRPYAAPTAEDEGDMWVVSDLTPGLDGQPHRVASDHVLGISSASTSLAQLTLRHPVERALDLGTGCGVQALHLARHSQQVVATDVNERALRLARFNAALNGLPQIAVRNGSFFEAVAGEQFDLVATNPPFVISPGTGERLVYRDSGLPGDQVVEHLVRSAPEFLAPGGWCQILTNWVIDESTSWDERIGNWLSDDCDAFVVQREVMDPAAYVELWLKDSGHHGGPDYLHRYDTWLSWLSDQGVAGVGFGWVNLRRSPGETTHRLEDWPYDVTQPIAEGIAQWGDAVAALRGGPDLLRQRLIRRPDVAQETLGEPGAADPAAIVVRQQSGFRRAEQLDTATAAVVGACDGDLTLGQILNAVAALTESTPEALAEQHLPQIHDLVMDGFLTTDMG